MKKSRREAILLFIGWALTIVSVIALTYQGLAQSFFHQDDVVELGVIANWNGLETLKTLNNEHLNITFWVVLRVMWLIFGTSFAPYFLLNILFHVLVMYLMYKVVLKLTKSHLWSSVSVWGMVINANWFTVVWWVTGLMIMMTTAFALLSYLLILQIREKPKSLSLYALLFVFSILPGMSWGVGLAWPTWLLLVYGINYHKRKVNKVGWTLILAQLAMAGIYFPIVGGGLSFHNDPNTWLSRPLKILKFTAVGVSNTLVGRWLLPVEKFRTRMVVLAVALLIFIKQKLYKKINDRDILFGIVVAVGSFATYAIPRWQFGIGHAMANYYAYFPLAFLLISVGVFLSKLKLKGRVRTLVICVFLLQIPFSWIGFESWAKDWVVRPQQTKTYFTTMNNLDPDVCLVDEYLPEYIVPQDVFKTSFIWPVFKHDWNPFCEIDQ